MAVTNPYYRRVIEYALRTPGPKARNIVADAIAKGHARVPHFNVVRPGGLRFSAEHRTWLFGTGIVEVTP